VLTRRPWLTAVGVWAAWAAAVVALVVIASHANAWANSQALVHYDGSLWPLFVWDYGWYELIAKLGYPAHQLAPVYAFFPLWPWLLRASGGIADWAWAFATVLGSTCLAFVGVALASPSRTSWRSAVVLACWPGSFLLLLAYPDALALAAAAWAAALALRGRPWLAGVVAAVAAGARPNGVLIAIPLALATRSGVAGRVFAAGAPIAAAGAVEVFFWRRSGDPRVFFHAQSLPIWRRNGPSRLTKWPGHLAHAFETHVGLIVVGAIVAVIVIALLVRFVGWMYALGAAYVFLVLGLLLGAQSPVTRIESAIAAVAFAALVLLWARGRAYLPWALFATAVLGISFLSGSVTSFGRQALFAFPLFWAVADGPRLLRHPLVAVAAIAANVAYALTLTKYAP
jgi:hypothetical protein